jgi:hypothetical protein
MFLRGRVHRTEGPRQPDTYCDVSFLRFSSSWEEVASRSSAGGNRSVGTIFRAVRRNGRGRARCSRGQGHRPRTAGSRRGSSSRDADGDGGGGGSGPGNRRPLGRRGVVAVGQ